MAIHIDYDREENKIELILDSQGNMISTLRFFFEKLIFWPHPPHKLGGNSPLFKFNFVQGTCMQYVEKCKTFSIWTPVSVWVF